MKTMSRWKKYLLDNIQYLGVSPEKLECWTENGNPVGGGMQETPKGIKYIDFEYRLATNFEEMPQECGGILVLMAYSFVDGLDREGLEKIDITIMPLDEGRYVDIEITFGVRDPIYVVPVENSPVELLGEKIGFAPGTWNIAEDIELEGHVKHRT